MQWPSRLDPWSAVFSVEFRSMNHYNITTQITYDQINLTNMTDTKFVGLIIDDTLTWKQHVDYVISKISRACYVFRYIKYFIPSDTLKLIYFAHIHSVLSYDIIFWRGSSCANNVFILQKRAIRIIMNSGPRESSRDLFGNWK
jgi:hypothetical protein